MKNLSILIVMLGLLGLLTSCSSKTKKINGTRYAKKIYLTKEDYMEDLGNVAQLDRREAQPNKESEYIFNVIPQTEADSEVYFFDKRQQPKIPGEYTAQDYKNEKRLWKKPKRYSPEQYYGMQQGNNQSASNEANYSEEESY